MSVTSEHEQDVTFNGGTSFWDLKQYLRTVKRLENSNKLCHELCTLIQERADLEKNYSSSLQKWGSKWRTFLEQGPEYGSVKNAWAGFTFESERISCIHRDIRTKLLEEMQSGVKGWQKEHFHKQPLPPQTIKEAKSLELEFEQAQKPWSKLLKRVQVAKKEYHNNCKMEKSYQVQLSNAKNDAGANDQIAHEKKVRKLQDKLAKTQKDLEKSKSTYEATLHDLDGDSARYMDGMSKVFDKSQEMENDRIEFFKSTFFHIHSIINISRHEELSLIYDDLGKSIQKIDASHDLKFWSTNHGSDMCFQLPQFEEYSQELKPITKKKHIIPDSGVTLKNITPAENSFSSPKQTVPNMGVNSTVDKTSNGKTVGAPPPAYNPFDELGYNENNPGSYEERNQMIGGSSDVPTTPGSGKDGSHGLSVDTYENVLTDDGQPGVKVRALYDYRGVEEDELTFQKDDVFEKLDEEDEQGWCKGRMNGRLGLYPANYVELV